MIIITTINYYIYLTIWKNTPYGNPNLQVELHPQVQFIKSYAFYSCIFLLATATLKENSSGPNHFVDGRTSSSLVFWGGSSGIHETENPIDIYIQQMGLIVLKTPAGEVLNMNFLRHQAGRKDWRLVWKPFKMVGIRWMTHGFLALTWG